MGQWMMVTPTFEFEMAPTQMLVMCRAMMEAVRVGGILRTCEDDGVEGMYVSRSTEASKRGSNVHDR